MMEIITLAAVVGISPLAMSFTLALAALAGVSIIIAMAILPFI